MAEYLGYLFKASSHPKDFHKNFSGSSLADGLREDSGTMSISGVDAIAVDLVGRQRRIVRVDVDVTVKFNETKLELEPASYDACELVHGSVENIFPGQESYAETVLISAMRTEAGQKASLLFPGKGDRAPAVFHMTSLAPLDPEEE